MRHAKSIKYLLQTLLPWRNSVRRSRGLRPSWRLARCNATRACDRCSSDCKGQALSIWHFVYSGHKKICMNYVTMISHPESNKLIWELDFPTQNYLVIAFFFTALTNFAPFRLHFGFRTWRWAKQPFFRVLTTLFRLNRCPLVSLGPQSIWSKAWWIHVFCLWIDWFLLSIHVTATYPEIAWLKLSADKPVCSPPSECLLPRPFNAVAGQRARGDSSKSYLSKT